MPDMEVWDAAVAAGLDVERVWRGRYDPRFLARVVAWHNLHALIDMHRQDASLQKQEEDARRHRRR